MSVNGSAQEPLLGLDDGGQRKLTTEAGTAGLGYGLEFTKKLGAQMGNR
jgi:hypothetical protein